MAKSQPGNPRQGTERLGVKGPLVFSAVLAAVAGVATTIFASGGSEPRVDLGLTAAGIAFIVSLVFCAMLMISAKPNDENLGKGSGVNRSSAAASRPAGPAASAGRDGSAEAPGEPRYGQRSSDDA